MKKILGFLFAFSLFFAPVVALAQDAGATEAQPAAPTVVTPNPDDLGNFVGSFAQAVGAKDWRLLGALICIALVWATRKFIGPKVAWFKTDRGGAVLALIMGALASVGEVLFSKDPWSWNMIGSALMMTLTAAGGFAIFKKIVSPSDAPAAK